MDACSPLAFALRSQARSNAIARAALAEAKSCASAKYFVYVLLLNENRIYIGSTDNIYQRLTDHFGMTRSAAAWVRLHGPPVRILEVVADADPDAENRKTVEYISRFGADLVRGGKWYTVFSIESPACAESFRPDRLYRSLSRVEIDDIEAEVRANVAICNNAAAAAPDP